MRKDGRVIVTALAAILICSPIFLAFPEMVGAKSPTPVEGVRFDVGFTMKDNLKSLIGKDVHVHLRDGKTLQGFVKSVGDALVHVEKLAGRDFFDALVKIEDISAIEVKFRDIR
jgi:hypothetical protein